MVATLIRTYVCLARPDIQIPRPAQQRLAYVVPFDLSRGISVGVRGQKQRQRQLRSALTENFRPDQLAETSSAVACLRQLWRGNHPFAFGTSIAAAAPEAQAEGGWRRERKLVPRTFSRRPAWGKVNQPVLLALQPDFQSWPSPADARKGRPGLLQGPKDPPPLISGVGYVLKWPFRIWFAFLGACPPQYAFF